VANITVGFWPDATGEGDATIVLDELEGLYPSILFTADGRLWLFYVDGDSNLVYITTDDNGSTWSDPVVISESVSRGAVGAASLSTGRILLLYYKEIEVEGETAVRACRAWSDNNGEDWTVDEVVT